MHAREFMVLRTANICAQLRLDSHCVHHKVNMPCLALPEWASQPVIDHNICTLKLEYLSTHCAETAKFGVLPATGTC